jgi:hypothetical protein
MKQSLEASVDGKLEDNAKLDGNDKQRAAATVISLPSESVDPLLSSQEILR